MRRKAQRDYAGWGRWWPFALLCVIGASRWMFSEALPGSSSSLASEALGCASGAALWLLIFKRSHSEAIGGAQIARAAAGGSLVLTGPLLALFLPRITLSGASVTMALALTPVVLGVIESAMHHTGEALPGRLWPGLAAIAGLLLLLSEPSISNPLADILLFAIPVLTGCGAALFCSARESPMRIPVALLGASAVFGVGVLVRAAGQHGVPWAELNGLASGLDAVECLLCLLALERLSAARWSAQFVLVPLLVLVQGALLVREPLAARAVVGLLLLAVASVAVLVPPSEEAQFGLGVPRVEPRRSE